MIRWLMALVLCLPLMAESKTVSVASGDHDGFTRLVLEFGETVDWQVGRTSDGYELQLNGEDFSFDVSGVYDLIGRSRLAAIWPDPKTGALQIGIGCKCHAIPFEFRPGILVIDLRDGAPPKASSFELALSGRAFPELAAKATLRPKARPSASSQGYEWTRIPLESYARDTKSLSPARPELVAASLVPAPDPELQPLREALLRQLSRGAAQGVVDMARPATNVAKAAADFPSTQIRIGESPDMLLGPSVAQAGMSAQGANCPPEDDLSISQWGDDRPVAEQYGEAMNGLVGEFDTPDPAAVRRAVRFQLYLGFGAEARGTLKEMATPQQDAAIWVSMARIIDREADPSPLFKGMAACSSAAALWAVLSDPPLSKGESVNTPAVLLSFSGLPVHLRRHLGPVLAERFLDLGETDAAQAVRDAILRAPGDPGPKVTLMEARIEEESGDHLSADARLSELIENSGPETAEALVTLLENRIEHGQAIEAKQVVALEGYLKEREGGETATRYRRALILARAASGDFDNAFSALHNQPDAAADLWRLLSTLGGNAALLTHATLPAKSARPPDAEDSASLIADRMLRLGFIEQAAAWTDKIQGPDRLFAARVALYRKDGTAALAELADDDRPDALTMRAAALAMLGDDVAAANVYHSIGDTVAEARSVRLSRDWGRVSTDDVETWRSVAALVAGPIGAEEFPASQVGPLPEPNGGPLANGKRLVEESAVTRDVVARLLTDVEMPSRANR